jgi:hypothetical protein
VATVGALTDVNLGAVPVTVKVAVPEEPLRVASPEYVPVTVMLFPTGALVEEHVAVPAETVAAHSVAPAAVKVTVPAVAPVTVAV